MAYPFLMKFALSRFSFKVTIWAWAAAMIVLVSPFLHFLKPRVPVSGSHAPRPQQINFKFLRSRAFLIFQLANILQSLGYFAPSLYLPTYARVVAGQSGLGTTAPVIIMDAGMVIGFVLTGLLIDRWHVANVILLATIGTTFGVFVVWGLSVSLVPLCVFALLYGIFAASASATWPGIVHAMRETEDAPTGVVLGLLAAGRGIGSIACGPLSEALLRTKWPWTGKGYAMGYGTGFGAVIVFTGVMAMFGTLGFGARRFGLIN